MAKRDDDVSRTPRPDPSGWRAREGVSAGMTGEGQGIVSPLLESKWLRHDCVGVTLRNGIRRWSARAAVIVSESSQQWLVSAQLKERW
jgi:hypothetical protein